MSKQLCGPLVPLSPEHLRFRKELRDAKSVLANSWDAIRESTVHVNAETAYVNRLGEVVETRPGGREYTIHSVPTHDAVPFVENLDERILECVAKERDAGRRAIMMTAWHHGGGSALGCDTSHCLAGWAVHIAGAAGYALEDYTDAERAGAAIFLRSVGYVPDFMAIESDERALDQLRAHVAARKAG